jgi:hypothetical protein
MKRNNVVAGIELVEIFGDVLAIPAISAESENERSAAVGRIGRDVYALERFAVASAH